MVSDPGGAANRAKLRPPRSAVALVPRPDLEARIAAGTARKLVVVTGPAGSGKTSVVAGWAAAADRAVAWIALDRHDADVDVFWRNVLHAIDSVVPSPVAAASASMAPGTPIDDSLDALVDQLDRDGTPVTLVLDDYHAVGAPAVDELVTRLLERSPPSLSVVVVSRTRPALPVPRFVVRGLAVEIGASGLAFSAAETGAVVASLGVDLDAGQTAELHSLCEGWAAGVSLATMALAGGRGTGAVMGRLGHAQRGYLRDYLVEEVLALYTVDERAFLEELSLLSRFDRRIAGAVTGRPGAGALLDRFRRSNAFIVEVDAVDRWYRFHHLFAELLRDRIEADRPDVVLELHRRAARWWWDHGFLDEAVDHALAGEDWALARELLDGRVSAVLNDDGRPRAVYRWLDALPAEVRAASPELVLAHDVARHFLGLNPAGPSHPDFPADEDITDAYEAALLMVRSSEAGDIDVSLRVARRALQLAIAADEQLLEAAAQLVLGFLQYRDGDIDAAGASMNATLALVGTSTIHTMAHGALALMCHERGDMDGARSHVEHGRRARGVDEVSTSGHFELAEALVAVDEGDLDRARAAFRKGHDVTAGRMDHATALFDAMFARELARTGHPDEAAPHARAALELIGRYPNPGRHLVELVREAAWATGVPAPPDLEAPRGDDGATAPLAEPLSDRERQVLRLLGGDLSLREIADELYVSHNTVKTHAKSIYRKLEVTTRAEAWARARRQGLLFG